MSAYISSWEEWDKFNKDYFKLEKEKVCAAAVPVLAQQMQGRVARNREKFQERQWRYLETLDKDKQRTQPHLMQVNQAEPGRYRINVYFDFQLEDGWKNPQGRSAGSQWTDVRLVTKAVKFAEGTMVILWWHPDEEAVLMDLVANAAELRAKQDYEGLEKARKTADPKVWSMPPSEELSWKYFKHVLELDGVTFSVMPNEGKPSGINSLNLAFVRDEQQPSRRRASVGKQVVPIRSGRYQEIEAIMASEKEEQRQTFHQITTGHLPSDVVYFAPFIQLGTDGRHAMALWCTFRNGEQKIVNNKSRHPLGVNKSKPSNALAFLVRQAVLEDPETLQPLVGYTMAGHWIPGRGPGQDKEPEPEVLEKRKSKFRSYFGSSSKGDSDE